MREIKFRIWGPGNRKYFYSGSTPSMLSDFFRAYAPFNTRDKIPFQQSTGLKDKNGKEIYEGDVVLVSSVRTDGDPRFVSSTPTARVVEYRHNSFYPLAEPANDMWHLDIEVIGNICENPELLN